MPVVTTTVSGGSAITSRVAARSAASSMFGIIPSAAACRTLAPRRVRAAVSSLERRSAVMSTTQPARVWSIPGSVVVLVVAALTTPLCGL